MEKPRTIYLYIIHGDTNIKRQNNVILISNMHETRNDAVLYLRFPSLLVSIYAHTSCLLIVLRGSRSHNISLSPPVPWRVSGPTLITSTIWESAPASQASGVCPSKSSFTPSSKPVRFRTNLGTDVEGPVQACGNRWHHWRD